MFGLTTFSQAPFSTLSGNIYSVSIDESSLPGDSIAVIGSYVLEISETVTANDTVTEQLIVNATLDETATATDLQNLLTGNFVFVTEVVSATDTISAAGSAYTVDLTETVAPSDNFDGEKVLYFTLSEGVTATESQAAVIQHATQVIETATATENITYTVDTTGVVTGVVITISLSSPLVWEQINDDQSPNWVQIKD